MADTQPSRDETRNGGDISSGYGSPKSPASPVSDEKAQEMLYSRSEPSGAAAEPDAPDEGGTPSYAVDAQGNTLTVSDVAHNEQDPLAEGGQVLGEGKAEG